MRNVSKFCKIACSQQTHDLIVCNVLLDMYEMLVRRSALALIDGRKLWDMHRPLENDCELELLSFQDENPSHANRALWRTCSLMLGSVITNAFKDHINVNLHSYPRPDG